MKSKQVALTRQHYTISSSCSDKPQYVNFQPPSENAEIRVDTG